MKASLKASILLNGLLVIALGISLAHHQKPAPALARPTPAPVLMTKVDAPVALTQPFHWSQLESTNNYRTYVENLRAIGCPDPTIRAIVTADFQAAASFEQRQAESGGQTASGFSPEATQRLIAAALGGNSNSSPAAEMDASIYVERDNSPSPIPRVQVAQQFTARATYPLAFANNIQSDSSLTPGQKAAVRQIQQQFTGSLGGPEQNPADPAYAARWQTARQNADDALRATLGDQAYLGYQLQQYYSNFQPVMLNAGDGPVTINPDALTK